MSVLFIYVNNLSIFKNNTKKFILLSFDHSM